MTNPKIADKNIKIEFDVSIGETSPDIIKPDQ